MIRSAKDRASRATPMALPEASERPNSRIAGLPSASFISQIVIIPPTAVYRGGMPGAAEGGGDTGGGVVAASVSSCLMPS